MNLSGANLGSAYLGDADLSGANLGSAYLGDADLSGANLGSADLSGANLRGVNLSGANLGSAYLGDADLSGANLGSAYLGGADLGDANLRGVNLSGADLGDANLRGVNLRGADLGDANLRGVNLSDTCLDPAAQVPDATAALTEAGIPPDVEGFVHAWRTARSRHVGTQTYTPGEYMAPVFSVDTETDCHPGIYLASREWLTRSYGDIPVVAVVAHVSDIIATSNGKFRARRITVLP